MKKILEGVGMVLLVTGGCGVLHELTGWFRFIGFTRWFTEYLGFLHGRELFANIVIAVVGFAVLMIADRLRKA